MAHEIVPDAMIEAGVAAIIAAAESGLENRADDRVLLTNLQVTDGKITAGRANLRDMMEIALDAILFAHCIGGDHFYLSTACLHDLHSEHCASDVSTITGLGKKPNTCKWCASKCLCACHSENTEGS